METLSKRDMKAEENKLLNEIGRLTSKKNRIDDEIKQANRDLEKMKEQALEQAAEIKKLNDLKKPFKIEIENGQAILKDLMEQISAGESALKKQSEMLRKENENAAKFSKDADEKIKELNAKHAQAKADIIKIENEKNELQDEIKICGIATNDFREEENKFKASIAVSKKERDDFENEKKKNVDVESSFDIKEAAISKLIKTVKCAEAACDIRSKILDSREADYKNLIEGYAEKIAAVEARESKAIAAIKSTESERQSLITERKKLEIDNLRFQKLVREKDLDKELAELRKG